MSYNRQVARFEELRDGVLEALTEASLQISRINQAIGRRVDLNISDLTCLHQIQQHGPICPSALAERMSLHPATMTGVLDRLELGGWVDRERDPGDRRRVLLRARPHRVQELDALYAGLSESVARLCAGHDEGELRLLLGFLDGLVQAGRSAYDALERRGELGDRD